MWFDLTALVNYWREELGDINEEGWVRPDMYEFAKKKNQELKSEWLDKGDPDERVLLIKGWPFQDREEFS